jgi:glutamate synthase (NADPH/NADH) large chain
VAARGLTHLDDLPDRDFLVPKQASVVCDQRVFGYTEEELKLLITPMAKAGYEPIGSMGTDTPVAVLSQRPRLLFDYFTQLFAQVTNPPLDAIREELVTSMSATIGPEGNLLDPTAASCRQIVLPHPVISNADLAKILSTTTTATCRLPASALDGLYPSPSGGAGCGARSTTSAASASGLDGRRRSSCSDRYSSAATRRSRRCCSRRPCTTT